MTPSEAVETSRAAQGLPRHIEDLEVLVVAAEIVGPALRQLRKEDGNASAGSP